MPFGKYKGHLVADLPGSNLHWFARKGFPAGELGRLLALKTEDVSARPSACRAELSAGCTSTCLQAACRLP
jgi:hypothetical protein